jgi:hypothetical protein
MWLRMTGAELLAIARHNCPPGMTDYQLAAVLAHALLLLPSLKPSQSIAVHRMLLRITQLSIDDAIHQDAAS